VKSHKNLDTVFNKVNIKGLILLN